MLHMVHMILIATRATVGLATFLYIYNVCGKVKTMQFSSSSGPASQQASSVRPAGHAQPLN